MAVTGRAPTGAQAAVVAAGQGGLMLAGAALALLIAQSFGKNAETDAFFAAYGMYGIGVTLAHTFRLTAVPRLVQATDPAVVTRLLLAVALVAVAAALPMLLAASWTGALLVDDDSAGIAPETLRILWLTLLGQLLAAMLATALTVRGAYVAVGAATLGSGVVSLAMFLLLRPSLGIIAAPTGLAISSLGLATVFAAALLRDGWRPPRLSRGGAREAAREAGYLGVASLTFFGAAMAYVVCVAIAAREADGDATTFAYAYMAATIVLGVTANASAMTRSPTLVASAGRSEGLELATVASFRLTLIVAGPAVVALVLVGEPVIAWALGAEFAAADARDIVVTFVCLTGWMLSSAAAIFAVVELLARRWLARLAGLAAAQVACAGVLAVLGASLDGTTLIAGALSLSAAVAALLQLRLAFSSAWVRIVRTLLGAAGRELLIVACALAAGAFAATLAEDDALATTAAAVSGAVVLLLASAVAWPAERRAMTRLTRRPS